MAEGVLGVDAVVDLEGIDGRDLAYLELPDPVFLLGLGQQPRVVQLLDVRDEAVQQLAAGILSHFIGSLTIISYK